MLSANVSLFFIVLLLIATLLEPLAKTFRIPFSIILVLIGFIGSEITVNLLGIDTGIRWHNFQFIIFHFIIPIMIFQAALRINTKVFLKNIVAILVMAFPLMLIATLITAIILFYGIGHEVGFPWIAALITGALLSATDPAAVLALLKYVKAPERLRVLLEGESLFNDATAIVLFSILLAIAVNPNEMTSFSIMAISFSEVFFGGMLVGIVFGLLTALIIKLLKNEQAHVLISTISAYSVFIITKDILAFSGVIGVLSCGITISLIHHEKLTQNTFFSQFWSLLAKIASSMIFILGGITITLSMFTDRWLAMLLAIVAVIVARFVTIMGLLPIITLIPKVEPVALNHRAILVWGGDRGTVTLALALSLPLTLDYFFTIQSAAYGVVVFTLLVQTLTMPYVLKKLINE